ncbi:hypothetical protein [Fluviicola taffensis]|uniref:Uncharacterized protein n=1 Tax=Fluviicola taffensis (strain DSM 16823 / NCIMB 13979 / RW262) TaxID=755732 RepID=F2IBU7_FLUTR|nr:hypothetical protein [Fluviicola taffensis]AEA42175.1 hypothetical protein Fluta_0166 [Fluviicola taffensis DSM 16823]
MNTEISRKLTNSLTLIRIIFGGLLFGIVSFLTAMIIIVPFNSQTNPSNELFQLIAPIFMVIAVSTSIFLRKSTLAKIHNETNPAKLIKAYTSSKIIQMAMMDASILFAIVCFVLTTNSYFVILSGLGILYFISLFPLQKKVIHQLNLNNPIEY